MLFIYGTYYTVYICAGTPVATVHFSPPGTDVFVHCFLPFLEVVPGTVEGTYIVQTIKDFGKNI